MAEWLDEILSIIRTLIGEQNNLSYCNYEGNLASFSSFMSLIFPVCSTLNPHDCLVQLLEVFKDSRWSPHPRQHRLLWYHTWKRRASKPILNSAAVYSVARQEVSSYLFQLSALHKHKEPVSHLLAEIYWVSMLCFCWVHRKPGHIVRCHVACISGGLRMTNKKAVLCFSSSFFDTRVNFHGSFGK